jgi:hypothetical protein
MSLAKWVSVRNERLWRRLVKAIKKQVRKAIDPTDPTPRPAVAEKRSAPRLPTIRTNIRAGFNDDPCEGGEIFRP